MRRRLLFFIALPLAAAAARAAARQMHRTGHPQAARRLDRAASLLRPARKGRR
jgi:hypothetical protein